jgi:DNA invertase Pin-like site-specific DNA recombinase
MPSAVIYTRVSTDEQAREGVSLDAQEARSRDYCRTVGLQVHQVYSDPAVSGSVPLADRPAGSALLASLAVSSSPPLPSSLAARERGPGGEAAVSAIVATKLDRLFRNTLDALSSIQRWDAQGISLHILDFGGQALDTRSAVGRMFLTITSAFAQFERDLTAERVSDALGKIASTGRVPTGLPSYGYDRADDGSLVENPAEAEHVREVFARYAAGASLNELARWLTSSGAIPKRRGMKWAPSDVSRLLANPVYVGEFRFRGDVFRGAHEALVDASTWHRAQARLELNALNRGHPQLTFGCLFRCGLCGSRVVWDRTRRTRATGEPYPYHRVYCRAQKCKETQHEPIHAPGAQLMDVVWEVTREVMERGDWQTAQAEAMAQAQHTAQTHPGPPPGRTQEQQLATVAARRQANMDALHRGILTMEDVEVLNAPLMDQERALRQSTARAGRRSPRPPEWPLQAQSASDLVQAARAASVETQVEILTALWEPILLLPQHHVLLTSRLPNIPPETRTIPRHLPRSIPPGSVI